MTFPGSSFNVVIDKGTLDALFTDTNDVTVTNIKRYLQEVLRVLQDSGRFICVSLAQQHIAKELVSFFKDNCFIRVHCINQETDDSNSNGFGSRLPVFVFVFTKLKIKCKHRIVFIFVNSLIFFVDLKEKLFF